MDNELCLAAFEMWAKERGIDIKKLTHGEGYRLRQEYNEHLIASGGKFQDRISPDYSLAKRMSREEASRYYNQKLDAYWLKCLSEKIPKRFRARALNVLLGRVA